MEKHPRSLASVGSELAHFHVIELFSLMIFYIVWQAVLFTRPVKRVSTLLPGQLTMYVINQKP